MFTAITNFFAAAPQLAADHPLPAFGAFLLFAALVSGICYVLTRDI